MAIFAVTTPGTGAQAALFRELVRRVRGKCLNAAYDIRSSS
jgi:hypothetical protein